MVDSVSILITIAATLLGSGGIGAVIAAAVGVTVTTREFPKDEIGTDVA